MAEQHKEPVTGFEAPKLPRLLKTALPPGPLALADFGCGDGPLFRALADRGYIAPRAPVYAVDLDPKRLARVAARFPWIETVQAPADDVPTIGDHALDFVCSTMVIEHVPDERAYLGEIRRVLKPGARAYVTTVFKKPWAWSFRRRGGETVLDASHEREYTDVATFRGLLEESGFEISALARRMLWVPILDPFLARVGGWIPSLVRRRSLLRVLRAPRLPIPGYFSLEAVVERREEL